MPKLIDRHASPPAQPIAALARDDARGLEVQTDRAPRILIVEDDFLVASDIELALQSAGFAVAGVAASADDAIAIAKSSSPDLAIVDIRLYGARDGIDAAIVMFSDHGIRCVFATAHADETVRARAAAASPLGWLQKPYTMPLLIDVVRRALAQQRG